MPAWVLWWMAVLPSSEPAALSLGSGGCGGLTGGVAVACKGANFEAATSVTCQLGRNHLHPLVVATVEDAYALLAVSHVSRRWQYGELGWKEGGRFKPHHTHQNGRSADFFFPVMDARGEPALLPINPLNLFGYRLHFKPSGRLDDDVKLDPAAVGAHLLALEKAGQAHGVTVARVIMDAPFQALVLSSSPEARSLKGRFNQRPVWIAHDQHYHVDFDIPARFKRGKKC